MLFSLFPYFFIFIFFQDFLGILFKFNGESSNQKKCNNFVV